MGVNSHHTTVPSAEPTPGSRETDSSSQPRGRRLVVDVDAPCSVECSDCGRDWGTGTEYVRETLRELEALHDGEPESRLSFHWSVCRVAKTTILLTRLGDLALTTKCGRCEFMRHGNGQTPETFYDS